MHRFRSASLYALAMVLICFAAVPGNAAQLTGTVQSGSNPIVWSLVTLHAGELQSDEILGAALTNANGDFTIYYRTPTNSDAVLYIVSEGGSTNPNSPETSRTKSAIKLASVLGTRTIPDSVVINEQTTVASAYAMAQFISGDRIAGKSPGLQNAAATVGNLVDISTGGVASVLGNPPNGLETSTMREFNSLANLLASCVDASTSSSCDTLFSLATPPGGSVLVDTLQAIVNVAHYPWQNVRPLYQQSQTVNLYAPVLLLAPDAWTVAIRYDGNGMEFDGPGNMAVDKDGNVWSTNNYVYNSNRFLTACGGRELIELTPMGTDAPGAPFTGGGLYGTGFGIAIDPKNNVWAGNFGFQGKNCMANAEDPTLDMTVSKFSPHGIPLSPSDGFTQGKIDQPQGAASDQQGNIWIANCGNSSVTKYPGGIPSELYNFSNVGLSSPFGMAIDNQGNAWVTSNGNNQVVGLAPNGEPLPGSPFSGSGIKNPLGIAVDSKGNVWVANSAIVELPCGGSTGGLTKGTFSITEIKREGRQPHLAMFTGGGIRIPWGVAVDGDDNVWVVNFGGQRLSEFCGATPSHCPAGLRTGDPISPATGFTSDGLTRNTGIAIDPSGNVWVANNWDILPVQTNREVISLWYSSGSPRQ